MHIVRLKNGDVILSKSSQYTCCIDIRNSISSGVNWIECDAKYYSVKCCVVGSECPPDILSMPTNTIFCVALDIDFYRNNNFSYIKNNYIYADQYHSMKINDEFCLSGYIVEMITESFKINIDDKGMKWIWELVLAENMLCEE